jgi:hypothetical protein
VSGFARVLRPGGQLLLTTLAAPGFEEWARVVNDAWARAHGDARPWFPEMPTPAELMDQARAAGRVLEHLKYQVQPVVIRDVGGFLSTMAVIAPNWLAGDPRGPGAPVAQAITEALTSWPAPGFSCTNAAVEIVARKPRALGAEAAAPLPQRSMADGTQTRIG